MALMNGYHDVPAGKVAAVVTHLEMLSRAPERPVHGSDGLTVRAVRAPGADWYRSLYARVGADWLWFTRLQLDVGGLTRIIGDASVEIHALVREGRDEGLLELDFRVPGECELTFFGLTPGLVGRGAGRLLMNHAIALAWARPIRRFWVHTCTLDHPAALDFYRRSGFVPFRRQVEIADDPRIDGTLPLSAAPQVPLIRP